MKSTSKRTLGLTIVILLVTAVPFGTISPGVSAASSDRPTFTVKQPSGACYVVQAYRPSDSQIVPNVVRTDAQAKKQNLTEPFGPYTSSNWSGSPTIESVMDYRFAYTDPSGEHGSGEPYGQTEKDAPYLAKPYRDEPWQVSTYGMYNWSSNNQSHMWFYDGPKGISLVIRHDRLGPGRQIKSQMFYWNHKYLGWNKNSSGGGAVSFEFQNLPKGQWAYFNDYTPKYNDQDVIHSGSPPNNSSAYQNPGKWKTEYYHYQSRQFANGSGPALSAFHGGSFRADWAWRPQTNDGGAYRGLQNMKGPITIENQFNQNATFWKRYGVTPNDNITSFQLRGANGKMYNLTMGSKITIERGSHCGGHMSTPTTKKPSKQTTNNSSGPAKKGGLLVRNVHVDQQRVDDGGKVTISAMVLNTQPGNRTGTVNLRLDGKVVNSTNVTLSSVSEQSVSFTQRLHGGGTHKLSVDGHAKTVHVQAAKQSKNKASITGSSTQSTKSTNSTSPVNRGDTKLLAVLALFVILIAAVWVRSRR